MRAWLSDGFEGISGLALTDMPVPEPATGQLRLAVSVCGVNFADTLLLEGKYQKLPDPPFAPGVEIAGTVEAVGEGVSGFQLGDRVLAHAGHGGFAETICVAQSVCAPIPDGVGDVSAAASLIAYGSADLALKHRARLKPGEWLCVLGAGGGVGLTGVEVGALMGANVIALARGTDKLTAAERAGAQIVQDSDDFDLSGTELREWLKEKTGGQGVNVLYDPVGGPLSRAASRAMAFEGRILPLGFASGTVPEYKANHLLVKNIDVLGFWWGAYFDHAPEIVGESNTRLLEWLDSGKITPFVSHEIPFENAPEALSLLKNREAPGKVVLRVQG